MSTKTVAGELRPARIAPHGDPLRYVFVEAPRCPSCGSTALRVYGKADTAGEGVARYTRCSDCGWRFVVVSE